MTHGLAMFNSHQRLIVCNERYAKLYGLPAELCKEGAELNAILQYLVDRNTFAETPKETFSAINIVSPGNDIQFTKIFFQWSPHSDFPPGHGGRRLGLDS